MAATEKQVVEVQEKLEDITECAICSETYKEPKILPCIHTFCMKCLQETWLKTIKGHGDKMPCPICRTEFTVPDAGLAGLQRNFFMERLIEMKNILNPSSARVVCDACQEDNELGAEAEIPSADMYCADCSQKLCVECCKSHRKYKATRNHRMLSLDDVQHNISSNAKPYVCDKHENKSLEIYCSSCQEVMCALCLYKSHKTHDTSLVVDVVTEFKSIIKENADSVKSFILDLKQKTEVDYDNKAVFSRQVTTVKSELINMRQNLQECIERDCDSLLQQLNSIKEKRIKGNEIQMSDIEAVLASLESYEVYCVQVTTVGSDVDICRAVHNLSARALELKQRYTSISFEPLPKISLKKPDFHDALYQTGNNIIGKIEENGNSKTLEAESIRPLSERISSFVHDIFDILDKAKSSEEKEDFHQLKEFDALGHSCTEEADHEAEFKGGEKQKNENKMMEKDAFVEGFETSGAMKEWTTCDDKFSDELKQLKIRISDLVESNDKLKSELNFQQECTLRLKEEITLINQEAEALKLTGMQSSEEIIDLKKQVTLLSSIAYNGDRTKVKKTSQQTKGLNFLQTVTTVNATNEKNFRVTGLAILDNELFISSNSIVVEVNDLSTLKFKRRWRVEEMKTVVDMTAGVHNKCLYLLCNKHLDGYNCDAHLLRFSAKGNVVRQWKLDVELDNARISVTDKSNVLLISGYCKNPKLTEYNPDGKQIRVISLKWESGIEHPIYAITLTSDHFLLCHGKDGDLLHRVCIIDSNGTVLKYYGEIGSRDQLNNPIHLEMAEGGNILVADHENQRLLLLNSSLELMQVLHPRYPYYSDLFVHPKRMIHDVTNGRMIVAANIWNITPNGERNKQLGDRLSAFTFSMQ